MILKPPQESLRVKQFVLPPTALSFAVILSRFTNSGVKRVAANIRSVFL